MPPSGFITVQKGDTIYSIVNRYDVTPYKLISENNYNLNSGSNRINLILDNLDEGSYLCRIKTNSGILSKNFNIIK